MAEGIVGSFAGKLVECTVDRVLRQIKYLFFYNDNIQNLRNKVQELENKRNDVKLLVGSAERNTEIIGEEVSAWLLKVDDLKEKADEVLNGIAGSKMWCLFNRCPNLKSRYLISKRATKKTIEADKLKVEGTFERVSYPRPPVQVLNLTSHEGFETRLSTKKEIKDALKDKDISIIGICGMPGVGKTTMAKEIVNEVKDEKLFEEVAFAVVSNDPDINKIQDQLAEMLGLRIEEKTNKDVRATRLHARLKGNNDKSILVVLDDIWKEIDLGTIGIPSPQDCKGLKFMFTTRIEETCSKMEAQTFEIEVLPEEEEWQLFKDTAEISDDETDVVSIAKSVARECRGLPLALVVVGRALRKKAPYKWRDALQQLQKSRVTNLDGMHNLVYSRIELSYNFLESNEDRDLLLLCSLFAEDESIPIENLVRYARGLELFPDTETLSETRDRAHSIADNLKSCNLLQPGMSRNEVKLHDVIRDFCLQMAIKEKRGYLVKHAGLKEWPEHEADESCSAISITFDKLDQLQSGMKYRKVKLLRVICRELGEFKIFEEFFKDMKELRVLELKGMYIQIPSTIQLLTGLRTLSLIDCKIHSQLSMIGSLKKLEILSFYQSSGDYSPIEFEFTNLCKLRSLDLRFDKLSCLLRPGVLSGMKKLEELYFNFYAKDDYFPNEYTNLTNLRPDFDPDGDYFPNEFTNLSNLRLSEDAKILSELDENGFINLKTLIINCRHFEYLIDTTNTIPNGTFGKLESLELRYLHNLIEICNGNLPRDVIKPQLFCNLVSVTMTHCTAIRSLFRESVAKCLVNLQILHLFNCQMLEEVVSTDAQENEVAETCKMLEFPKLKNVLLTFSRSLKSFTSQSSSDVVHQTLFNQVNFPSMEELTVDLLYCIEKLLGKGMPVASLHKLKVMSVSECAKLLTIAESDSIQLLQNLEDLQVSECNAFEVLFDFEGINVTNDDAEINMLGRLHELTLHSLPKLVHITRMVPKGIRVFQNLTNLHVIACESLRYLFSPSIVNSLVALEDLTILNCKALEEIIGREEEEEENTLEKRNIVMDETTPSNLHHFTQVVSMDAKRNEAVEMLEFPKLNTIELRDLSNFKSFRSETNNDGILQTLFNQVTLPNMKKLEINGLHYIVKLVNMRVENSSKSLQNLEILEVEECKALEMLFDFECLMIPEDHAESVFGRLRSLQLKSLDKLVHIIGIVPKGIRAFENLTSLVVERCGILKYLFSPSMANSLVALKVLEVSDCESIKAIVGKEEEEEGTSEIKRVEAMKTRNEFPKLDRLLLRNLSSIQMFCSHNCNLVFPLFKDLTVENCPMMTKLSPWPVTQ